MPYHLVLCNLFVLFCIPAPLRAQYDDLLRNPDISWVAEYTSDFVMDPGMEAEEFDLNSLFSIQFRNGASDHGLFGRTVDAPHYLSQQIMLNIRRPATQVFEDSLVMLLLSQKNLDTKIVRVDTVIRCFENTLNDSDWPYFIVTEEIPYTRIKTIRVRQVYWYDRKNRRFDSRLLSYAPVFRTFDDEGNEKGERVYFWLGAGAGLPKRLSNEDFNYVFQTFMWANAPGLEDFKVKKGSLDIKQIVREEISDPSHLSLDAGEYQPIGKEEMGYHCFGADTLINYTYETNQTETVIVPWNRIEQIAKIRFVHNWYYDARRARLCSRLVGMAPMAKLVDQEGEFRYYTPLFYQMYR